MSPKGNGQHLSRAASCISPAVLSCPSLGLLDSEAAEGVFQDPSETCHVYESWPGQHRLSVPAARIRHKRARELCLPARLPKRQLAASGGRVMSLGALDGALFSEEADGNAFDIKTRVPVLLEGLMVLVHTRCSGFIMGLKLN